MELGAETMLSRLFGELRFESHVGHYLLGTINGSFLFCFAQSDDEELTNDDLIEMCNNTKCYVDMNRSNFCYKYETIAAHQLGVEKFMDLSENGQRFVHSHMEKSVKEYWAVWTDEEKYQRSRDRARRRRVRSYMNERTDRKLYWKMENLANHGEPDSEEERGASVSESIDSEISIGSVETVVDRSQATQAHKRFSMVSIKSEPESCHSLTDGFDSFLATSSESLVSSSQDTRQYCEVHPDQQLVSDSDVFYNGIGSEVELDTEEYSSIDEYDEEGRRIIVVEEMSVKQTSAEPKSIGFSSQELGNPPNSYSQFSAIASNAVTSTQTFR